MFEFQSECKWETVQYYLDLSFTKSIIRGVSNIRNKFGFATHNIANRNPFVNIIIGDFNARSKIGVLVIKHLMKVKSLNT